MSDKKILEMREAGLRRVEMFLDRARHSENAFEIEAAFYAAGFAAKRVHESMHKENSLVLRP